MSWESDARFRAIRDEATKRAMADVSGHAFGWLWSLYSSAAEYLPNDESVPVAVAHSKGARPSLEAVLANLTMSASLGDETRCLLGEAGDLPRRALPPGTVRELYWEYCDAHGAAQPTPTGIN